MRDGAVSEACKGMLFIRNFMPGICVGNISGDNSKTDKVRGGQRTKHFADVPALKHVCHLASRTTTVLACIGVWF